MRKESEVRERIDNYLKNRNMIKNEHGRNCVNASIAELDWVLGGEGK